MKKLFAALFCSFLLQTAFAQDLGKQRIWKISNKKKSVYFDQGIFHSPVAINANTLKSVRNSYDSNRGFERVVFDFDGVRPPKVYGHISSKTKKLYIDFFKTKLKQKRPKFGKVKFLKSIDFFDIDKDLLSVEMTMASDATYEIFYLEAPARVVIDIKK